MNLNATIEIQKMIENDIVEYQWEDCKLIIRSFFTTLSWLNQWEVDTSNSDQYLYKIYDLGGIEDVDVSFDEFQSFMVELLVWN